MKIVRVLLGLALVCTIILIMVLITPANTSTLEAYPNVYVSKYVVSGSIQENQQPATNFIKKIQNIPRIEEKKIKNGDLTKQQTFKDKKQAPLYVTCSRTIIADKNRNPESFQRNCVLQKAQPEEQIKIRELYRYSGEQLAKNLEITYN